MLTYSIFQLLDYLTMNKLITVDQSAYLKNHSPTTCLHRVIDDWLEQLDDKNKIGACFLDISKCFDAIDYSLLIVKLSKSSINNVELNWFTDYLSSHEQIVCYNNKLSGTKSLNYGVPQGLY